MRSTISSRVPLFAGAAGLALALAACGSSGGGSSLSGAAAGQQAAGGSGSGIAVRSTSLGKVLTSGGKTVYMLTADKPGHQACTSACQGEWPPVPAGGAHGSPAGVSATLASSNGQLTVNGHYVYTFTGDSGPGSTNGEGITDFGGTWYALTPAGAAVPKGGGSGGSSSGGSSSGGSAGGYGY